jgi:membrane protein implicated in regulation of membrane protease activity
MFVESFPYLLTMGFVLLFVGLSWLLKRYDFSYKRPLIAIFAVLLVILTLLGYAMANEPNVSAYYKRGIPFGQGRSGIMRGRSFVVGEVVETENGDIHVETLDGKNYEVKTDRNTKFPRGKVDEGDMVRVVGEVKDKKIDAYAIGNLRMNKSRHRRLEKNQIMEESENTTTSNLEAEEEKSDNINSYTLSPIYQNTESVTDIPTKSDSANNSDIFQEKEGPGYTNNDKVKGANVTHKK